VHKELIAMHRRRFVLILALLVVLPVGAFGVGPQLPRADAVAQPSLTEEERGWLARASRREVNGWLHVTVQGTPFERGFQHGYLTAAEFAEAIRVYSAMTLETTGFDYSFFVDKAVELHKDKITPELLDEMAGLAAGYSKAGVPTTVDDIVGWNAWTELTGYWWPTVASQYAAAAPSGTRKSHCSAFIATGSATADGRIDRKSVV
jgi:hypothetical protein